MTDTTPNLAREFGGPLPPGLAGLSAADQAKLVAAIEAARKHQNEALMSASEDGLSIIPKLLRGPVKKVLFG